MDSATTFERFWLAYPRHTSKKDAYNVWCKLNPSEALVNTIIDALAWQRVQHQWVKENGRYVPEAAKWLRGEKWNDEPPKPAAPVLTRFASLGMHRVIK